jgi:predicted MFS family arabinose efflux permease
MLISISIGTITQSYFAYLLNGPLDLVKDWLAVHPPGIGVKEGILVTSYSVGGFLGCIISFFIVKTTSRRKMVFLTDFFYFLGSLGCIIPNFYIFIVGRTI